VTERDPYQVLFTSAARHGMNRLPRSAPTAMFEHLTGPVAENPRRLGKQLDWPLDSLRSTRGASTGRSTPSMTNNIA
jgi:mRNA interferase RelE/StbE